MSSSSTSARAKFAAQLTGTSPPSRSGGSRAKFASQLTTPRVPGGEQDGTNPARFQSARAQHFAAPRLAGSQTQGAQVVPMPLVVALPSGQLGVYTPQFSPLDPAGVFTRHTVWLPPTGGGYDSYYSAVGPDRSFRVDWGYLWHRFMAIIPKPTHGYVFYGDNRHATGSVPTHARSGKVVGSIDITALLNAMDVTNAQRKDAGTHTAEWAIQIELVLRMFNNLVTTLGVRDNVTATAGKVADDFAKGPYQRLKKAGWIPLVLDSAAIARLPVHAVLPKAVTYSGHKTSMEDADMDAYRKRVARETTGSSQYALDHNGDSVVVNKHYRGKVLVSTDTVKAR